MRCKGKLLKRVRVTVDVYVDPVEWCAEYDIERGDVSGDVRAYVVESLRSHATASESLLEEVKAAGELRSICEEPLSAACAERGSSAGNWL